MKFSLKSLRPSSPLVLPAIGIGLVALVLGIRLYYWEHQFRILDRHPPARPDSVFTAYPIEILDNGWIYLDWERVPGADYYILECLAADLSSVTSSWVSPHLETEIPFQDPQTPDHIQYWRLVAYRDDHPVAISPLGKYPSRPEVLAKMSHAKR